MTKKDLNYFGHYITHTYYVVLAWKAIRGELWCHDKLTKEEFDQINRMIAWHDQTKMDASEWMPYAEWFYGNHDDENAKIEFKEAVQKHKEKNLHHFESLRNYKGPDWKCYIIELVCDYIAMGWEFDNYILEYYASKKEEIRLPDDYKNYLESILEILRNTELLEIVERPLTEEKKTKLDFFYDIIISEEGPQKTYSIY